MSTLPSPPSAAINDPLQAHGLWAMGVVLMRNLGLTSKVPLISVVFLVSLVNLVGWLLIRQADSAMSDRQHVKVVHGVLQWAYSQETYEKLSREQAQDIARHAIAHLRYDKKRILWDQRHDARGSHATDQA